MSERFVKIAILWNWKTNPAYKPAKNPRYNIHSWRYANFSKLIERGEDFHLYKKSINLQIMDILLSL